MVSVHTCRSIVPRMAVLHGLTTRVVGRSRVVLARELLKAYHIRKKGDGCISVPFVDLYKSECSFLDSAVR